MSTATTTAPLTTGIDIDKRVAQYIALRDKMKEIKDRHKDELGPYNETLEQLNALILAHLDATHADNVGTAHGTAYKSLDKSATIADKTAFWTWIVTQGKWDMIDYKANAPAVEAYINEQIKLAETDPSIQPVPPPGVNYTTTYKVGVRRKTGT